MSKASNYEKQWKRRNKAPVDPWGALEKAREELDLPALNEKPPGAFTVYDYAARFKIGRQAARGQIERMITAGRVEEIGRMSRGLRCFRMKGK